MIRLDYERIFLVMRVGIMQPYFFPYIGYFQLINAVDSYVNLDHVSFMTRSFMTRNVLKNNTPFRIPVQGASQSKKCSEIETLVDSRYLRKTYKTIEHLYKKSINYEMVMDEVIAPSFAYQHQTISEFNINSIKLICQLLSIGTKFYDTSEDFMTSGLTGQSSLIEITNQLSGSVYINAIGGKKLYSQREFEASNIELLFLKMGHPALEEPYLSIVHQLFCYPIDYVKEQLESYELV